MTDTKRLMRETLDDDRYEEEWVVKINTGGEYTLSKIQARILMQSMSAGKREVIFQTFVIAIPYIAEFYRDKRFLKDTLKLPETATEKEYKPIPKEQFEKIKREAYAKIGKRS